MADYLLQSALVYAALMNVQYRLVLGKKNREYTITLSFPADGYHHLAGFQYARGIMALRNKQEALNNIRNGTVTSELLITAGCYTDIEKRCKAICWIPDLMRENRFVFHYNGRGPIGSRINAKYVLTYDADEGMTHFFINGDDALLAPASIFIAEPDHYTRNCPRMTTLEIIQIEDGQETQLYRSSSYKK